MSEAFMHAVATVYADYKRSKTNILLQDMIWLARSSHRFIGFDRADKEMAAFKDRIFLKE